MNLRQIGEPTAEPISLEQVRQQLHEDFDPEDEFDQEQVLPIYIQAAREYAESATGLVLTDALYEARFDEFDDALALPVSRVGSVESVKYIDSDGAEQDLDDSVYEFDDNPDKPKLRLKFGQSWPTPRAEANAVRIRFRGIYTQTDSPPVPVPASIQQAMLLLVAHWYENREEVVIGAAANSVPNAAASLLWINRVNLGV